MAPFNPPAPDQTKPETQSIRNSIAKDSGRAVKAQANGIPSLAKSLLARLPGKTEPAKR